MAVKALRHEKLQKRDMLSFAYDELEKASQEYNNTPCRQCAPVSFSPDVRKHELFEIADFQQSVEMPFETVTIPCPVNYSIVLERAFGDWHKHVVGASSHGGVFLDLDRPYTEYLKK